MTRLCFVRHTQPVHSHEDGRAEAVTELGYIEKEFKGK